MNLERFGLTHNFLEALVRSIHSVMDFQRKIRPGKVFWALIVDDDVDSKVDYLIIGPLRLVRIVIDRTKGSRIDAGPLLVCVDENDHTKTVKTRLTPLLEFGVFRSEEKALRQLEYLTGALSRIAQVY